MASNFGSLCLSELKAELKKRNAKQSGRKKELIERLEAYERNFNFGASQSLQMSDHVESEYKMKLPDVENYMDLHSDKKFPLITMTGIETYLHSFQKSLDSTPIGLYKEKHLCYIRACYSEDFESYFLKSACRAEMKKAVVYQMDMRLSIDGDIQEAQCECGAGMGPTAHCKHVCALLYAGFIFSKSGTLCIETTCTEKLQSFNQVKRHKGSPVKSCNLNVSGANESTNVSFDPRPMKFRKMEGYADFVRNSCINFIGASRMPIMQLFGPANIRAMCNDHDYFKHSPENTFLESIGLLNLDGEKQIVIEKRTRGQTHNALWFEERAKRLQSSNFGRICKLTERTDKQKFANELLDSKTFKSKATEHGKRHEQKALNLYEQMFLSKVSPGFDPRRRQYSFRRLSPTNG